MDTRSLSVTQQIPGTCSSWVATALYPLKSNSVPWKSLFYCLLLHHRVFEMPHMRKTMRYILTSAILCSLVKKKMSLWGMELAPISNNLVLHTITNWKSPKPRSPSSFDREVDLNRDVIFSFIKLVLETWGRNIDMLISSPGWTNNSKILDFWQAMNVPWKTMPSIFPIEIAVDMRQIDSMFVFYVRTRTILSPFVFSLQSQLQLGSREEEEEEEEGLLLSWSFPQTVKYFSLLPA